MSDVEVREELEDVLRTQLEKAYIYGTLAAGGSDWVPLCYPEVDDAVAAVLIATVPPGTLADLLERAQNAIAFERERADKAEAERDAFADSTGTLIAGAGAAERERAERAAGEADRLRTLLAERGQADEAREYLSPGEAARKLQIHPNTLQALEKAGELTAGRTPAKKRSGSR